MKKITAMVCIVCLVIALSAGTALAANTDSSSVVNDAGEFAELMPVDVIHDPDNLEIRKIYELSPDTDPGSLPRESFERGNFSYECTDIGFSDNGFSKRGSTVIGFSNNGDFGCS